VSKPKTVGEMILELEFAVREQEREFNSEADRRVKKARRRLELKMEQRPEDTGTNAARIVVQLVTTIAKQATKLAAIDTLLTLRNDSNDAQVLAMISAVSDKPLSEIAPTNV
jgi:hypothetical protein